MKIVGDENAAPAQGTQSVDDARAAGKSFMEMNAENSANGANNVNTDVKPAETKEENDDVVIAKFESAMDAAKKEASEAASENSQKKEDSVGKKVDIVEHINSDAELKAALVNKMRDLEKLSEENRSVVIEKKHKDAFLDCIVTGERYKETFDLFGNRLHVVVRCRSAEETEAIEAYTRREIASGRISLNSEYAAFIRKSLLSAQIDEINGVKYDTLKKPMFSSETKDRITSPGWLEQLDVWASKPDYLVAALFDCIVGFEARYWAMIRESKNENFWKSGESTGE